MKILFWQWNAFMQKGIENALKELNIEYDVLMQIPSDWEGDALLERALEERLQRAHYDKVLSVNYCPVVSNICQKYNVTYISWVYDSPVHIRDISSFANACNRIYFFDRGQMQYYKDMGYVNVFHMPLAADEAVWRNALNCSRAERERYACDVAFVGQLYNSDYEYLMGPLPLYERGEMEGIISAQGILYGAYILDQLLDDEMMARANKYYAKASGGRVQVSKAEMEYAFACEVTGRERRLALTLLASRCNLHIHSTNDCSGITGAVNMGYADYYTQMPAVFSNARINLNISLKTIRTGIPLRVLDVMSCGGFLITNYQEELMEYFEPGTDLVIYEDVKDLAVKTEYYLAHDDLRRKIAQNGHDKVAQLFGFTKRLESIIL